MNVIGTQMREGYGFVWQKGMQVLMKSPSGMKEPGQVCSGTEVDCEK